MILLSDVWSYEAIGVKDDGDKSGELICVKRTETVLRDRLRDLGHILAS